MLHEVRKDELIHKSHLFELRKLDIETPGGQMVERDMICHPGAALVVPILEDGSVVMIRNYRYPANESLWELPCGTLDDGEEPLLCAQRELTEETGYTAAAWTYLGSFYSCPGYSDEQIYCYQATNLTEGTQQLEEYEQITVEIVKPKTLREMVANDWINDAKTLGILNLFWTCRAAAVR